MAIVGKIGAILKVDTNPALVPGISAPESSLAEFSGDIYIKIGPLDTDWSPVNGGSSTPYTELRVITSGEAIAKEIILSATPTDPTKVVLNIRNSPSTFYGDDFIVVGDILSWDGLALDGLISAGDKFTISYWV